jgi:hydroxyacylglutathione hydrolase
VLGRDPALARLPVSEARRLLADGAALVDVRPVTDFAAGHVPGTVAIPLRAQFATWLGWLLPPDVPLVVVRNPDQDPDDILWPALNIGYEQIRGELAGGIAAWAGAGGQLNRIPLVGAGHIGAAAVPDVRQDGEYAAGHLPGALHIPLGDLPARAVSLPAGPAVVMCGHGERAMTAASLLERAGRNSGSIILKPKVETWARKARDWVSSRY